MARLFLILGLVLSLCACQGEQGSESRKRLLTLRLRSLEQGTQSAKTRRFVPFVVEIENKGRQTIKGRLRVFRTARKKFALSKNNLFHERMISIPPGRRLETVHYYLQDYDPKDEFAVLFEANDSTIKATPPIYPKLRIHRDGLSVLILSDRDDPRMLFNRFSLPSPEGLQSLHCSSADLAILPTVALSYSPYDAIVISDCDLNNFGKTHREALQRWVNQGGWLIVSPGLQAGVLQRSALFPLLPLDPSSDPQSSDQALNNLRHFTGGNDPAGVATVHHFKARDGAKVLCKSGSGWPLIITQRLSLGRVTVLSFPLMSPASRTWSGTSRMLFKLLPGLKDPPMNSEAAPPIEEYLLNVSSALEPLTPPSIAWVGPLLLLYAIFVAPVSFTIARRKRSPGLFFLFALGIIGVTILIMVSLTWATKGKGSMSTHSSIVHLASTDQPEGKKFSMVDSVIGLFFSKAQVLEMSPSPDGLAAPITRRSSKQDGRVLDEGDEQTKLSQIKVATWSFRRFQESRQAKLGSISSQLTIDQDYIVGTVTNTSTRVIEEAIVLVKGQIARIGSLRPGASVKLRKPLFPIRLGHKKTVAPFLDRLLKDIPSYQAYYPEASFEQALSRKRVFAAFQRRALMLKSPTGAIPAMLIGFWEDDVCQFQSSINEPVSLKKTVVLAPLFLDCPSGRLRLTEVPGFIENRVQIDIEKAFHSVYTIHSTLFAKDQRDPKGRVQFVFEIPVPPGQRLQASQLIFEARLEMSRSAIGPNHEELLISAYDFHRSAFSEPLKHDGKSFRYRVTDPDRFFNSRTGRCYLKFTNNSSDSIEVNSVQLRITGKYQK
jgi:hypothetical protein